MSSNREIDAGGSLGGRLLRHSVTVAVVELPDARVL